MLIGHLKENPRVDKSLEQNSWKPWWKLLAVFSFHDANGQASIVNILGGDSCSPFLKLGYI